MNKHDPELRQPISLGRRHNYLLVRDIWTILLYRFRFAWGEATLTHVRFSLGVVLHADLVNWLAYRNLVPMYLYSYCHNPMVPEDLSLIDNTHVLL
jgi:hypothetical protein